MATLEQSAVNHRLIYTPAFNENKANAPRFRAAALQAFNRGAWLPLLTLTGSVEWMCCLMWPNVAFCLDWDFRSFQ